MDKEGIGSKEKGGVGIVIQNFQRTTKNILKFSHKAL